MPQDKKFYITTPIYYGNGLPHVGHFYSSTIANILFKYHKISGVSSRFTTGIDENSQKAVIKAQEADMGVMEYLDYMAVEHQKTWDYFNLDYTDFIRTTSPRHHSLVQEVLQHCYDKGDIYQDYYSGKYCIGCEAYKKDDELIPHPNPLLRGEGASSQLVCADHLTVPELLKEKNYFFKLTRYQTWIEEFYDTNPDFVLPHFRYNEVKAFVGRGLEDFSISRETNTFGIPLPFDTSQVTYVWFDALFNYYTSCKYSPKPHHNSSPQGEDEAALGDTQEYWSHFQDESKLFWESDDVTKVHIVGKDIIRFHAIFWPAMLASYFDLGEMGEDGKLHYKDSDREKLPTTILTGGYFTVDGQKMSKSLGNVIDPIAYSKEYSKELLGLYILSAFPIGNDGDYSRDDAIKTYNAKLANNLGNLVNRVVVLSLKLSENSGILKPRGLRSDDNIEGFSLDHPLAVKYGKYAVKIGQNIESESRGFQSSMKDFDLKFTLDCVFRLLDSLNKFADETQPWQMIKTDEEGTREVLYTLAEGLRQVGLALYPFFPEKMSEMFEKLGLKDYAKQLEAGKLHDLLQREEMFVILEKGEALFKRIEV
ncbi:methionine--tRNA ligase [Candidatus Gracilibacteria bacterium]|nr:methionine--tRNA ligase [Candidatus Gracilibacteria bacterium]